MEDQPSPATTARGADVSLPVIIGPGFHAARLTDQMVRSLPAFTRPYVVSALPADPLGAFYWLTETLGSPQEKRSNPLPLIAIGFSAGVVGLAGALTLWQQQGGTVARFFALDGWGVPVIGLPVCRLSHDFFTHWSTLPLGSGKVNFYADPPVDHLQLWGDLERVQGWQISDWPLAEFSEKGKVPMTAAEFLRRQIKDELDSSSAIQHYLMG